MDKKYYLLLAIFILVCFSPCLGAQFLHWDDTAHFLTNPYVYSLSWNSIVNIFSQTINDTYVPLTILTYAVEYCLFGFHPWIGHLINIILHMAAVFVIFGLLGELGLKPLESFLASAIFALHPMHVESVAWVTERKDVLGLLFYVLSLKAYGAYLRRRSGKSYALSLMFGFLSVLAKPMAVSLPWILFLFDWFWQRRLNWKMFLDKIPFAFGIFPIAAITFFKLSPHPHIVLPDSLFIGLWTFSFYLGKFFWPMTLLPLYTPPEPITFINAQYLEALVICILFFVFLFIGRKNRWWVFACLFWVGTIFFFWRFDFADVNIVADRFMYLPSLGFCLLAGYYLARFRIVATIVIITLGVLTFNQCFVWNNDLTLWTWTLSHDPKDTLARGNLNIVVYHPERDTFDFKKFRQAISLAPHNSKVYLQRGAAVFEKGNAFLALNDFNKAIALDASNYRAYNMRGQLYRMRKDYVKALADFDKTIAIKPDYVFGYVEKAMTLGEMADVEGAFRWFDKALQLDPKLDSIYYERGLLYQALGQCDSAIAEFTKAVSLNAHLKNAYYQRGRCYERLQQWAPAGGDFIKVLQEDPYDAKTVNELGAVYVKQGDYDRALKAFNKAIDLDPYFYEPYNNRGIIYLKMGQYHLALQDFTKAIARNHRPYHALITRGDIYFMMGQRAAALKDYDLAVLFSNGDRIASLRRDRLLAGQH